MLQESINEVEMWKLLGVGSQFHNVFSNLIFKDGREGVPANLR